MEFELSPGGLVLEKGQTFNVGKSPDSDIFPVDPSKDIAIPIRFTGDGHRELQMFRLDSNGNPKPNGVVYQALPVGQELQLFHQPEGGE